MTSKSMKMQTRRRAPKVWLAIFAIVVGHNVTAEDGDTLSEWIDECLREHPWLTRSVIAAFALHLANAMTPRYDVIHVLFVLSRKWRRP